MRRARRSSGKMGLTGYELKERLESEGRALPIIFMTAHSELPVRMSQDAEAVANCLRKPFGEDELLARVRRRGPSRRKPSRGRCPFTVTLPTDKASSRS